MKEENNYIKSVSTANLLNNLFEGNITFKNGLNIVAGENGTGKTKLLSHIVQNRGSQSIVEFSNTADTRKNIVAFSPKRNAQKMLIEQALNVARSENAPQNALKEFLNRQIEENSFSTIKSISEYLTLSHQTQIETEDKKPSEASSSVQEEFGAILNKIFDYKINFSWNTSTRKLAFDIAKTNFNLKPDNLSTGENAIISLIFAIYFVRKDTDVYLIDEPEVHLNWQLEEKLFSFLDWFCNEHSKQIIIATHSRACFIDPFIDNSQFLLWKESKIISSSKPDEKLLTLLSGDIVKIIGGVTAKDKLVYVEDNSHKLILDKIKELKNVDIEFVKEGSCENVKRLSKAFKKLNIENVYFLVDNDNKPIATADLTSEYANLIQLKKYCIENYFLNEEILNEIDKRSVKTRTIKQLIEESIKEVNEPSFKSYKKLIENNLLDTEMLDFIDSSKIIETFRGKLGFSEKKTFFEEYLIKANEKGLLDTIFSEIITLFV
ncbi:ATP-binding protein [Patescibacteria group bacterium]|nr:ATP-binding protein [Patescibacteria group bacterium]MBU1758850.1 ATP-binding protein [Patescibacteria group bacterium]MBU1934999.1 ATP-binding protein [Patescibacteria group bacterium]